MSLNVLANLYPGEYVHWQILWIQNVLLVFVQFTTGAALYEQNVWYFKWLWSPFLIVTERFDRGLLITVHALSGITVVGLNLACTGLWFYTRWTQGTDPIQYLFTSSVSVLPWTNVLITIVMLILAISGTSLYRTVTPGTSLPLFQFGYALARNFHRIAFVSLVLILGYHLFFFMRVSSVWIFWLSRSYLFGILAGLSIIVWAIMAGLSLLMIKDWLAGTAFSKAFPSGATVTTVAAVIGCAILLLGVVFGLLSPGYGSWIGTSLGLLLVVVVLRRGWFSLRSTTD